MATLINRQSLEFSLKDLTIGKHSLRTPYRRRTEESKKAVHWGQRKLLLSEIEFFTFYWDSTLIPNPLCVYAGAAPGTHITLLSKMFPAFTFHLYDPSKFDITETDKIRIFNEYFTEDVAKRYSGRTDVFFVSDIRTADYKSIQREHLTKHGITEFDKEGAPIGPFDLIVMSLREAETANEDKIWGDMNMQQNWVQIMNPEHALLKFRLPYAIDGKDRIVQYLKGIVYWQPWAPQTSTETRLKPIRNKSGIYDLADWSILEYEQWSFHHNVVDREENYYTNIFIHTNEPIDYPELLNDYDSVAEAMILKFYFEKSGVTDPTVLYNKTKDISRLITWHLNHYRTDENIQTLAKIRSSPIKSTGKSAVDAFRAKCGKKRRTPTNTPFQHTKVEINPTWRQPATIERQEGPTLIPITTQLATAPFRLTPKAQTIVPPIVQPVPRTPPQPIVPPIAQPIAQPVPRTPPQPIVPPIAQPVPQTPPQPIVPPVPRTPPQPILPTIDQPIVPPIAQPVPQTPPQPIVPPVPRTPPQPILPTIDQPIVPPVAQPIVPSVPRTPPQPILPTIDQPIVPPVAQPIVPSVPRNPPQLIVPPIAQPVPQTPPQPVVQPVVPPIAQAVSRTPTQPVVPPIAQPIVPPVAQPVSRTPTQPVVPPIAQPIVPPVSQPVLRTPTQPVVPPIAQPIVPPVSQPVLRTPTQPVVPPVAQPVLRIPTQPVIPPIAQPVPRTPPQPIVQPVSRTPTQPVVPPIAQTIVPPIRTPTQPIVPPIRTPTQPIVPPIRTPTQPIVPPIRNPTQPIVPPIRTPTQPIITPIRTPTQPVVPPIRTQPVVPPTIQRQ